MGPLLSQWLDAWTSFYSNSALLRTGLGFAHVAGLVASGGTAIVVDRATLAAWRSSAETRLAHARVLDCSHRAVVLGLIVVSISGVLLLAADADTYLHSRVFWIKMACIVALLANGRLLVLAGRRAQEGEPRAWTRLAYGSMASLLLWFLTTLMGAALPNV